MTLQLQVPCFEVASVYSRVNTLSVRLRLWARLEDNAHVNMGLSVWDSVLTCRLCVYAVHTYDNVRQLSCKLLKDCRPASILHFRAHAAPRLRRRALSLRVGSDGSGVAVWRAGAGVTALMWDDSIGAGLMGLICSNWKWSRSWSWGQGPPGAYCHHTSARWRRCICVCWSPGGWAGVARVYFKGVIGIRQGIT